MHVLALFLEMHFHYSFTMIYQKKIGFEDFFINLKLHFKVTIYCKSKSFFGLAKSVSEDTGSLIHIHKSCFSKHKQQSFWSFIHAF